MTYLRTLLVVFGLLVVIGTPISLSAQTNDTLWAGLKSGTMVVVIRHALAPGTGDPGNFTLGDCSTQRNLSDTGRDQAKRIGDLFRVNGIADARVLSSQWCRCMETAEIMALGDVQEFPTINSFFRQFERRDPQTRDLRDWIANADLSIPTVMVTHQVNITALTGVFPSSGELVFVERSADGATRVAGTIKTN